MKKQRKITLILLCVLFAGLSSLYAEEREKEPAEKEQVGNIDEKKEDKPDRKPVRRNEKDAGKEDDRAYEDETTQQPRIRPNPGRPLEDKKAAPPEEFPYEKNYFDLNLDAKEMIMDRLQWRLKFWTSFNYFNNADLRELDDTNEESIRNTDDRMSFGVAGAELDFFIPVNERLDFRLDIWKMGLYGNDQLAGRDRVNDSRVTFTGSNTVNFGQLWFNVHLFKNPKRNDLLDLKIGRQFFDIGGAIDREYYMFDIVDAAVLNAHGWWGNFDILAIDYFGSGVRTDDVNFVQFLSYDETKINGFDGKKNTWRSGAVYKYSFLGEAEDDETHLDLRAFYFAARIGAGRDGGADTCNNGTTCNDPDEDFNVMRGIRLNAGYEKFINLAFTYGESFGVDRKARTINYESRDIDTNGKAYHLELEFLFFDKMLRFTPSYFYAQGGKYRLDATQYSHGFVSFKGQQAGGILADLNWGNHPTAYTDDDGYDSFPFADTEGSPSRKSGTEVQHLFLALDLGLLWKPLRHLELHLKWWRYNDTNQLSLIGETAWSPGRIIGSPSVPTAYERDLLYNFAKDFYPERAGLLDAYRAFGLPMGEEYNVSLEWSIYDNWRAWATWGVLRPMRFYTIPGLVNGAPEGNALFTGFQAGTTFFF